MDGFWINVVSNINFGKEGRRIYGRRTNRAVQPYNCTILMWNKHVAYRFRIFLNLDFTGQFQKCLNTDR